MAELKTIRDRYQLLEAIGRGGMGVVYRAFDPLMRRDVAIKTLHDVSTQSVLDLFYREIDTLRKIVHPNIVDILDMGEYEEDGVTKPYYVMPLLPGNTLYDLLHPTKDTSRPLGVDRAVEIITQTCRALHAAHENGLLHRDVKPRNIFVIDEYSVKVIDFGVAHLLGSNSATGVKGTLEYMAPEQLNMKSLSRKSDLFSLATVSYEMLTGQQPFRRPSDVETAGAVMYWQPPLACEVNPSVSKLVSQVVNKAMAKDPLMRFTTAAEFADTLRQAQRNEPLGHIFDSRDTRVRVEKVRKSLEQNDYQFASELLVELEAEGHSDPEIRELRQVVDRAMLSRTTDALYEKAERYFRAEEYALAHRKVQEVLELDSQHQPALALKTEVERVRAERKIAELLRVAGERLENSAFDEARRALRSALIASPKDPRVQRMLDQVDARQNEVKSRLQEQNQLFRAAQEAWERYDADEALQNLEHLLELTRKTPGPRHLIVEYNEFYQTIKKEHNALHAALAHARQLASRDDFESALSICVQFLEQFPGQSLFTALRREIEEKQKAIQQAFRAGLAERLSATRNLSRRIELLHEACQQYPQESDFSEQLRQVQQLQQQVAQIEEAARAAERDADFEKAVEQWSRMRFVYPDFEGLEEQIRLVKKARNDARAGAIARWRERIAKSLDRGDLEEADGLFASASGQFPGEFDSQRTRLEQLRQKRTDGRRLLSEACLSASERRHEDALRAFRDAYEMDPADATLRRSVINDLVERSESAVDQDWKAAERYLELGQALDKKFKPARDLTARIQRKKQQESTTIVLAAISESEAAADYLAALQKLEAGLLESPDDPTLLAKRAELEAARRRQEREIARQKALEQGLAVARSAQANSTDADIDRMMEELHSLAAAWPEDGELKELSDYTGTQLQRLKESRAKVAAGDLAGARAICNEYLPRFPRHPGFLDVVQRIADAEARNAAEFRGAVDRRLAGEPSAERQIEILEEARRKYPDDAHFNERLKAVRQQQAVQSWTAQIQAALQKLDYPGAVKLAAEAQAQVPGAFAELEQAAKSGLARRERAQSLVAASREFGEKGQWDECRNRLRQAVESAADDLIVRQESLEAHTGQAKLAVKSNWQAAEALLHQASDLDASFVPPSGLRAKIEDKRRSEAIEQALETSKQLQQSGELQKARETLDETLRIYPDTRKLVQRKAAIEEQLRDAARREERRRCVDELRQLEGAARIVAAEDLGRLAERAREISKLYRGDMEIEALSVAIEEQVETLERARRLAAEGDLDEAERIADGILSRFKDHSASSALKKEVREARQRAAAAYRTQVSAELKTTPDLARREEILVEALRRFPNENSFRSELEQVRRKRSRVDEVVKSAREADAAGNYDAALEHWKSLRTIDDRYPGLEDQIRRTEKLLAEARSKAARKALGTASDAIEAGDLRLGAELLHKAEAEFGSLLGDAGATLKARLESLELAAREREWEAVSTLDSEQPAEVATAPAEVYEPPAVSPPEPVRQPPPKAAPANSKRLVMIAGAAAAILAGVFVIPRWMRSNGVAVSFRSDVAGAVVRIGEKTCTLPECALKLPPGNYTLTAAKDGYTTYRKSITLTQKSSAEEIPLSLEPLPQVLQVNTNLEDGLVYLDDRPAAKLRDGQFTLSGIAPGQHKLRVTGGGAELEAHWRSQVGQAPQLVRPVTAKAAQAAVVTNVGQVGNVACNCGAQGVAVDGTPVGKTGADGTGVSVRDLREGTHQLTVGQQKLVADVRPNPTIDVFLSLDRDVGELVVATGQDNTRVYLNNRLYRRVTEHGTLRIPVDSGNYSVRVEKDGFVTPPAQGIEVKKGEQRQVVFELSPAPAALQLAGALPGAQVAIDGRVVGQVGEGGAFQTEVSPGEHQVELTSSGYTSVSFRSNFNPGKTVQPPAAQITMSKAIRTPSAAEVEAQDWDRIRNSGSPEQIDEFLQKHAEGAHAAEARNLAAQLRRQAGEAAARQAEQSDWARLDKNDKGALQAFLARHPGSQYDAEAQQRIAQIEKTESAAKAAAEAQARQKTTSPASDNAADVRAIQQTLANFEAAYSSMDLQAIRNVWPGMPKESATLTSNQFQFAKAVTLQLRPAEAPVINGNSATVICLRRTELTPKFGKKVASPEERVRVTLQRAGAGWVIQSIAKQ